MNHRNGFIIFVVVGIIGLVGMMMLSVHWYSQQRNVQSHRSYYNEQARIAADSGLQLLLSAIREGIKTPDDFHYKQMLQLSNTQKGKNSFFAYFLRHLDSMDAVKSDNSYVGNIGNLSNDLFPAKTKNALNNFLKNYPGMELKFQIQYRAADLYSSFESDPRLRDRVEKKITLVLHCTATIKGVSKSAAMTKKLLVYNLLPSLTSRFTLYHKTDIGNRYNKLITYRNGRPPQWPNKSFKNALSFPLFLFNGPREEEITQSDRELLQPQGGSYNHLHNSSELTKIRQEILRRGYLYFGSDQGNVLRLTPGAGDENGYGQYFMLFNIHLNNGLSSYWATQNHQPEYLNETKEISNWHPGAIPEYQPTEGRAYVMSFYDGFYETATASAREDPRYYLHNYDVYSSLIHPFGSRLYPSRAYTVGKANLEYIQLKTLAVDRKYDDSDESAQKYCNSGKGVPRHDAYLNMLPEMTEFEWPGVFNYNWIKSYNTEAYVQNCPGEPAKVTMTSDFTPENIFIDYEGYQKYMSEITRVPLNHIVDYPHYTHESIPPTGHADFKGYIFSVANENAVFSGEIIEYWPYEKSLLHPNKAPYFEGSSYGLEPDKWDGVKNFYYIPTVKELETRGYLAKGGDRYYLNTSGQRLVLNSNLNLELPLEVTGHSGLTVTGECQLSGVQAKNTLFAIHCQKIIFSTSQFMQNPVESFDGLYNAVSTVSKSRPDLSVYIFGGLATGNISDSVFTAPTAVSYDPFYKPTGEQADYFYRIVMDEKRLPEKTKL